MSVLDRLAKSGSDHKFFRQGIELARIELAILIVEAARGGAGTTEIASLSGYSKDRVRRMLRDAGIDPISVGRPRNKVKQAEVAQR